MTASDAFYQGYLGVAFPPEPQAQFEAVRVLRGAGWSFIRIASALGISLSQCRVAVDTSAAAAHERWAKEHAEDRPAEHAYLRVRQWQIES